MEVNLKVSKEIMENMTWDAMIVLGKAQAGEPIGYADMKEIIACCLVDEKGVSLDEETARRLAGHFKVKDTSEIFERLLKSVADFSSASKSVPPSSPAPTASAEVVAGPDGSTP